MYERFFALTKAPFSTVSDPDCVHLSAQHAEAINGLAFGVLDRKGYLVLTGEAGLGKTTALRSLCQILGRSNANSSMILAPTLTAPELLELAMLNFGFKDIPPSKARRLKMLEEFLLWSETEGRVAALLVDEAHQLGPDLLEELRLLGNFETVRGKLLQIVLVGQSQLNDLLNLPQLWQFKQRIAIRLSLQRLDGKAVEEYIRFRWDRAGGQQLPFDPEAIDAIAAWSNGTPRLINAICDNALMIAFSETTREVDATMVREACEELSLPATAMPAASTSFRGTAPLARALQNPDHEPAASPSAEEQDAGKPSLMNRWRRRSKAQDNKRTRSRSSILPLHEP